MPSGKTIVTKPIRHTETARDSLYQDLAISLDNIYAAWQGGEHQFRFVIPVMCAIKLEAFINVAGKLRLKTWNRLERSLAFLAKCEIIAEVMRLDFDPNIEPDKSAIKIFEIRNALVHPKLKLETTDEMISEQEYERRRDSIAGIHHHLRDELTQDTVIELKNTTDRFVELWGPKFLEHHEYWLTGGSTGGFAFEGN